jgi:hypothetical protein
VHRPALACHRTGGSPHLTLSDAVRPANPNDMSDLILSAVSFVLQAQVCHAEFEGMMEQADCNWCHVGRWPGSRERTWLA